MPRGKEISIFEECEIMKYRKNGMSQKQISAIMNRSQSIISKVLNKPTNYQKKIRTGRPKKLKSRDKRRIFKLAVTDNLSCNKIKSNLGCNVSKTTIWRTLNSSPSHKYLKMKSGPLLTTVHKATRLDWAKEHQCWSHEWNKIVFSDEKKFNLDGPDGYKYYWHDIRHEDKSFLSRNFGGGSCMVWAAFSACGTSSIVFVTNRLNSQIYQDMLEEHLIPIGASLGGPEWIFQQDNASCHASRSTKLWAEEKGIRILGWPSRSPDLNPIENLWGILARAVYSKNTQFNTVEELKSKIIRCWSEIDKKVLNTLVSSMPNRIFELIRSNGGKIKY